MKEEKQVKMVEDKELSSRYLYKKKENNPVLIIIIILIILAIGVSAYFIGGSRLDNE